MLKKRIIPIQLLLDGRLVKTRQFAAPRDVGDPVKSSAVYNSQTADELIFLNIARGDRDISALRAVIEEVAQVSFMPIAMGGGIRSASDAAELIATGTDKVVVNSAAYANPDLIGRIAATFGTQAVIVSIDARWHPESRAYRLFSDCGRAPEPVSLADHIRNVAAAGAGEIMIQSIDRDGMMGGYDIDLIHEAMAVSSIPVIAAGGSGNYQHLQQVFEATDVSAVACGSLFNFSDSNPVRAKAFLSNQGLKFKLV